MRDLLNYEPSINYVLSCREVKPAATFKCILHGKKGEGAQVGRGFGIFGRSSKGCD